MKTLLVIVICVLLFLIYNTTTLENMINIPNPTSKYSWDINQCPYIMTENIKTVFAQNGIAFDKNKRNNKIILPCTYDNIEKEIANMNVGSNGRVFIIHGADQIVAKDFLWKNLVVRYGINGSTAYTPLTYLLYDENDLKRLNKDFDNNKLYIMKKNIQRQEGLKITNSLNEIMNNEGGYILVQELLQNPYLLNKRKINLRIYVLVVCHEFNYEVFMYGNGFMYYTKEEFKKGTVRPEPHITTGYIDRHVYEVNPLTHEDFRNYLDNHANRTLTNAENNVVVNGQLISEHVFGNIGQLIKDVFSWFHKKIGNKTENDKLFNQISFQLFGVDVAIDDQLHAQIMEVNKGPDLGSKDKRDGDLKKGLILDILRTTGVVHNSDSNKFIKLIEV